MEALLTAGLTFALGFSARIMLRTSIIVIRRAAAGEFTAGHLRGTEALVDAMKNIVSCISNQIASAIPGEDD